MPNSSFRVQDFADSASRRSDLSPTLATAGHTLQPALDIATAVANNMCRGGPDGQRMNWKWNRINVTPNPAGVMAAIGGGMTFLTNAFQQDYAVPGVINVDWIEEAIYVNINQMSQPKQVLWGDPKRNLSKEYTPGSSRGWKICFFPNYLLEYGIWGQDSQFQISGMKSAGPGAVYTYPLGAGVAPNNPCTQVQDPNGNFWVLTTYGTCGTTQPTWTPTPTYPTLQNPAIAASTVADGSCVWTALNPNGQGFRLGCPPAGNQNVWAWRVVAQMIPHVFTSLGETLGVIPDDHADWFRIGFEAFCMDGSPDAKVRAKSVGAMASWYKALRNAVQAGNREQEDQQLVPTGPRMDFGPGAPTPYYPFPGGSGG